MKLVNDLEGGTNGTQLTAGAGGNTDGVSGNFFDNINTGSGATEVFSNTHAAHGFLSVNITTSATAAESYVEWTTSLGTPGTTIWFRTYVYLTALPGTSTPLIRFNNAGGQSARLVLTTTGVWNFNDSANTTILTGTSVMPTNAWFRVEGFVIGSSTAGQLEVKSFTGNADGTVPVETLTSGTTVNTRGILDSIQYGVTSVTIANVSFWLDDIGVTDVAYLGPAVTMPGAMSTLQAVTRAAFW